VRVNKNNYSLQGVKHNLTGKKKMGGEGKIPRSPRTGRKNQHIKTERKKEKVMRKPLSRKEPRRQGNENGN